MVENSADPAMTEGGRDKSDTRYDTIPASLEQLPGDSKLPQSTRSGYRRKNTILQFLNLFLPITTTTKKQFLFIEI